MSEIKTATTILMDGDGALNESVGSMDEALMYLADALRLLRRDAKVRSAAGISFDEVRNRAIYELNGEVASSLATPEDASATLPWLGNATVVDGIADIGVQVEQAVLFIEENASIFEVAEEEEE